MAIFKNPLPEGMLYHSPSEKRFIDVLQDLPSRWLFWYQPTVQGGRTPDFILWAPAEEFASIFLLELKNWRRSYISRVDMTYVYLRNTRKEYNPISKLKLVRNNLHEALAMHYQSAPGLERIAVIPLLIHWGMETREAHPLLRQDAEVQVLGQSAARDAERLSEALIGIARRFYSFAGEAPPIISLAIKTAILSCVDLSLRARPAGGRLLPAEEAKPVSRKPHAPLKPAIRYDLPLSPLLDDLQHSTIHHRSLGHFLLSGAPGTGKTILLLGRLKWFSRYYPHLPQLFIVHQKVLITHLKQRYRQEFLNGKADPNIHFFRFKDWFARTFQAPLEKLYAAADAQSQALDELVAQALAGKLPLQETALTSYGHVCVDEAHQMPGEWIRLLARFAQGFEEGRPNLWIAYDNGQGIYRNRRFEGQRAGLNFQGRAQNFHRVYRCGLLPWVFAACCHPKAFFTYRSRTDVDYLEFTRLGKSPLAIVRPTLAEQARKLAEVIEKKVDNKEIRRSDVTIFYAVAGMGDEDIYPDQETKSALDAAFERLGGIEWVAINKSRADWTSERVRACTFTSSQGIDAPVAVLFGVEFFKMFNQSNWLDADALFYTVLTRSTDTIILTYSELADDPGCRFQSALFRGVRKAEKILPRLEALEPVKAGDDTPVYRIKWAMLDRYINL